MRSPAARIGDPVDAIETPALVIELDAMQRNLARMADFARDHKVRLRPHAKLHKSGVIAQLQMRAGAVGVCVQKPSEAEALADAGVADIFISNEVIALSKLERVAALAKRIKLAIAVDSVLGVERLAAALNAMSWSRSTSARAAAASRRLRPAHSRTRSSRTACGWPACRLTTGVRSTCGVRQSAKPPPATPPARRAPRSR